MRKSRLSKKVAIIYGIAVAVVVGMALFRSHLIYEPPEQAPVVMDPSPAIAVLPFDDMSPDQDQGWLCDGIAEEILNRLAQIPGLKVAGRTSSFAFRNTGTDIETIGRVLDVNHVLEGSVRKDGSQLRVTAQLVRAEDGMHVWSHAYDREIGEVFAIQDDISGEIAFALQLKLAGTAKSGPVELKAIYPDYSAYELYLQALSLIEQNTKNALADALAKLQSTLEIEPDFADAHVAIARVYLNLAGFDGFYEPGTAFEKSRILAAPHVDHALAIDPNNAEAWVRRSHFWVADHPRRLEALEKALSLNPNLSEAHLEIGIAKNSYLLPWSQVIAHVDRAVEIEPLSIEAATTLVVFLSWIPHRWQEAESIISNLELREPNSVDVKLMKAMWLLNLRGRPAEAVPILEEILVNDPDHSWARSFLTKAWYMLGEFEKARRMPGGVVHWRYVLAPDRLESRRLLNIERKYPEPIDFGRRIISSYAFIMLREWQSAVDLLANESGDLDLFTRTYVENFVLNESPALSLAMAYKALGSEQLYRRFADLEKKAVNIRTDHGQLHNFEYSRAMARLLAMEGNGYEAILELERLITLGPIDPRELIHPAFDELRDDPEFKRLVALQRERVNRQRAQLELPPLSAGYPLPLLASGF